VRKTETHIEISQDRNTGKFVIAAVRGADWVFIRDEPILADAIQIAQHGANSFGLRVIEKSV